VMEFKVGLSEILLFLILLAVCIFMAHVWG
jgi:hypothetical protein